MDKEEFLSKLNIKDYNNQLEKTLEKKSFSEGTKNILLNILYKIETSYEDYTRVKVGIRSKREILEEVIDIIENNCNEIELIKPKLNEETKLKNKSFIVEKENKKIISYPNEKTVFYGIYHLQDNNFIINNKNGILKEPMEKLLNQGYIIDKEEIIRDFDGWSWNIASEEIENHIYNVVFQNIKILLGENFLQEYVHNIGMLDFIDKFEKNISNICDDEELFNEIIMLIYKISILENVRDNNDKKNKLFNIKNQLQDELNKMENKKNYLQDLANKKKAIGKDIKQIDEVINNNKLLREQFIEQNKKLKEENKIFSLSEYSEVLQTKRKKLLEQLKQYGLLMKPMNYVKTKSEIKKQVLALTSINIKCNTREQVNNLIIDLQKNFLRALDKKIKKIETKKAIMEYVYLFRYYKLLPINNEKQVKDIDILKEQLNKTEKYLITRGCNLKAINILCHNIEKNYEMISKILNSNIIDLEEMNLEFKKQKDKIILNIYDDNMIDNSIEYDGKEELNIKFNKKIKLFN